jgi:hypothetical protein
MLVAVGADVVSAEFIRGDKFTAEERVDVAGLVFYLLVP